MKYIPWGDASMPTRTINLKMILPRKAEGAELRQALWTTHEEINKAVAYIEGILLLCRGESYWTTDQDGNDVEVLREDVRREALKLARAAQAKNNGCPIGSDDEVLSALRTLYKAMVPSCVLDTKGDPKKGNAQSIGNSYAGPLFSKSEAGPFADTAEKLPDRIPEWAQSDPVDIKAALEWARGKEGNEYLSIPRKGNDNTWKTQFRNNSEQWPISLAESWNELQTDPRLVVRELAWRVLHLLPLAQPYFSSSIGFRWTRGALRLAVAHLLSWESWNHRTAGEFTKIQKDLKEAHEDSMSHKENLERLREYERKRHEELKRISFANDDNPYRIGKREIRAWDVVTEQWKKVNGEADRKNVLIKLQRKLKGKYGDPELYNWLAKHGNSDLVADLPQLVLLNSLDERARYKKPFARYTAPDARLHPQWISHGAPYDGNLEQYELKADNLTLILPLLTDGPEGMQQNDYPIPVAPSEQFSQLIISTVKPPGKKQKYHQYVFKSAHQEFSGTPSASGILFDRSHIEHRQLTQLRDGDIGALLFKLPVDVEPQAPKERFNAKGKLKTPDEVKHFRTSLVNKSPKADSLSAGFRVLSVDLGLRTFASCSVFELVQGKPEKGLHWLADADKNLWAKHERSFLLRLPGEDVFQKALEARKQVTDEVRHLKQDVRQLKELLRLGEKQSSDDRKEMLDVLRNTSLDDTNLVLTKAMVEDLANQLETDQDSWRIACRQMHSKAEILASKKISKWRTRTRPKLNQDKSSDRAERRADWIKRRGYHGGKSIWAIEYLDSVRRLLMSWSLRGRKYKKTNRLDYEKRGTFASHLLQHINNLKEDRIKSGTDLIIQAARGYVPCEDGGWRKAKHEPCHVILFEDLARYRFRIDRPRRENAQLMKWNHREILKTAEMQAELYGITVEKVNAGFTSRYDAKTGAPGVRCRRLKEDDFENGVVKDFIRDSLKGLENVDNLKPDMLVPWEGGEEFVTLLPDSETNTVHADINAAQNLQRRFWTRYADAYRLPCIKAGVAYYPKNTGVRLRGGLAQLASVGKNGFCKLEEVERDCWRAVGILEKDWNKDVGNEGSKADEQGEDETQELIAELDIDERGDKETFFRDPSGVFFSKEHWVPAKVYWGTVKRRVFEALQKV